MSLKDYRALVAPNNDDYFYAKKYRTDCDLFHCKTGAGFHRRRKDEIPTVDMSFLLRFHGSGGGRLGV